MARIAIFASGNGSNFEVLAQHFEGSSDSDIVLMVCDRQKARVRERARRFNIPELLVNYVKEDPVTVEERILGALQASAIDVIFLAGYMRIFNGGFLKKLTIPMINIHPSLLPKYKGINSIARAFEAGDKEIGITIHHVVEEIDSGTVILQKSVKLEQKKGLEYVENEVHKLEHIWYPRVARQICDEINANIKKEK